ncbi:MAG: RHS repeat-associated core domain-containing protein [Curvibacter sp.]|nr:RHS repeat-associated core domain-containing protein [Curvibacter sp.]
MARLDAQGQLESIYYYGDHANVPEGLRKNGQDYRILTDQIGSVRLVVNTKTGEEMQRIDYDEWGQITLDTNPGFQPFGFAGGLYDPDTGLTRFGARDYDGETGRWTAKDPILFWGGEVGLYSYVSGNPISNVDPNGLAYFGTRPLQGLPWLGPMSNNPLDNWSNTAIAHEQLFFEDGKLPGNIGFFGDSKLQTESSPSGYRRLPGHYNDCVMRMAAQAASTGKYNLATNNCQSWADRAREQYEKLMKSGIAAAACGL